MPWVAGAIAGSAVLGAGTQMAGSGKASGAAKDAANLQKMQYLMTRQDLSPFTAAGAAVTPNLLSLATGSPTGGGPDFVDLAYQNLPLKMTQAELEQTPGYQFTRDQGLKSVQSSAAARGLGISGAALKGAAEYTTGLANKTYQDQFNLQQKRFADLLELNTGQQNVLTNQYNRVADVAKIGANAAAGLGQQGVTAAQNAGNSLRAAGTAEGTGLINAGNAVSQGVQNYLGYQQFQNYMNPTGGTSGYGMSASGTPGISASGNPVMTGYAPAITPGTTYIGGFQG